jgi:hypothetical protein
VAIFLTWMKIGNGLNMGWVERWEGVKGLNG